METDSRRIFNKLSKDRYLWGNKVGKQLAGALKKKSDKNFIDKIQNKNGELIYTTKEIGDEFRKYYAALYSVRQKGSQQFCLFCLKMIKWRWIDQSQTSLKNISPRKKPGSRWFYNIFL